MSTLTPSNAAKRWLMIAPFVLASCGGGSAEDPGTVQVVSGAIPPAPAPPEVMPTPTPSPTPTPPLSTTDVVAPPAAPDYDRTIPAAIASNFDTAAQLGPKRIPPSAAPDVVGAFRFLCQPSHLSYDDPIVFPGQPGKAHLHQWFGNSKANANSTYASLRSSGESTCMGPLNRSAYWMPAMLVGADRVVTPDYVSIYYKRLPTSSPDCKTQGAACVDLPRGLRYVFGFDMVKPKADKTGAGYFDCQGTGATRGHYATITEAVKSCPAGAQLGAIINAPSCWDGVNLDSPDHRSHMAYAYRQPGVGNIVCPKTHPYVVPTFTLGTWYTMDANGSTWRLSSDEMRHDDGSVMRMTPGSTFHADWFGAWDDETMQKWMRNCVDKMLNCSDGDLGNGQIMMRPKGYGAKGTQVPVPTRS